MEIDSRQLVKNGLFIAIKGTGTDGHEYINQAIDKGAIAVVLQNIPGQLVENITYIQVDDSRYSAGLIASAFYDHPSQKLDLIGVTGTNGKTSLVQMSHRLFNDLGHRVGMLSTIENKIGDSVLPATLTTPDAVSLHRMLARMVAEKCTYAFMEVSSHALDQQRTSGCQFKIGIFTNITHDHLDYHGTFDNYLNAKKSFFDHLGKESVALINIDDRHGSVMVQNTHAEVQTYALRKAATYKGKILDNSAEGLHLQVDGTEIHSQLVGAFNASNLLAVYAIARITGHEKMDVLQKLSTISAPPGRMEVIKNPAKNITGFVDYAHTPDALKNVLETINEIKRGKQNVITVIGCGGNRDALKRPVMARIAVQYSDRVILTSDNPRFEDPEAIIREMEAGIPQDLRNKVLSITSRKEAIKVASALAPEDAIILIAGKGHETYQEVKGVRTPFDDRAVLQDCFTSVI